MTSKASHLSAFVAVANTVAMAAIPAGAMLATTTEVDTSYTNAVAYAASNTYVNDELTTKASLAGATFTGALVVSNTLTISGNLIINGTTTTVNTSSINVTDSLLYLASNNQVSDTLDIGFAAHYNYGAGANGHTGLIRSASTKKYHLFQNYQPEFYANNNVDVANTATGIQPADLVVGSLNANTFTANGSTGTAGQVLTSAGSANAYWANNTPAFPSGTAMLFAQTSAPTGWTKQTTHNNKALRVVSGTAGSGGTSAFTTVFGSRTPSGSVSVSGSVGATTLTEAQIPSHTHTLSLYGKGGSQWTVDRPPAWGGDDATIPGGLKTATMTYTGGGGSHTHTFSGSGSLTGSAMDFDVQYVDVIIATKD